MHNFEDKKCWKPMIRKYRACVSLSGNVVDVIDVHDQIVASFTLSIKFGKVALEEMISHSLIVIPTDGNAESFSPFSYDYDSNTIKVTIMKTDGQSQVFQASIDDLMKLTSITNGYIGDDYDKPSCGCDKLPEDKEENEGSFDPVEDLDPGFSYDPNKPSCGKPSHGNHMHFEPEHCKPHKPLVDPYVTRSELMEESKKRQRNDCEIRDMIGNHKEDNKSIFGHIDSLTSGLNHEVERSRHEDKVHSEKIEQLDNNLDALRKTVQTNDCEVRKLISKETNTRADAYSELYRLVNLLQTEDTTTLEKIEKLNKEHNRDTQILRTSDRELHGEIMAEQSERVATDKELRNLIRIEETNRFQAVKEALTKVDVEYHRASIAEEEIKVNMDRMTSNITKEHELLNNKIENLSNVAENKYQPKGEYVPMNAKGIFLDSDKGYYISSMEPAKCSCSPYSVATVNVADNIEIGDFKTNLQLVGKCDTFSYNGETVAFVKDIPSLTNYVQRESLNDALVQITNLQTQLMELSAKYTKLESNYDKLKERVYQLELKG